MSWGGADASSVMSAAEHKAWVPMCEDTGSVLLGGGGWQGAGWKGLSQPQKMAIPVLRGRTCEVPAGLRGQRGHEQRVVIWRQESLHLSFQTKPQEHGKISTINRSIGGWEGGRCL